MKNAPKKIYTEAEKKIKNIWDILLKQNFVSFNLSIKVRCKDLWEKKIYSVDYERAPDGGWRLLTPTNKNHTEFQTREILQSKLLSIQEKVCKYIAENALEEKWIKQIALMDDELACGLSADDLQYQSKISVGAYFGVGYDAHFSAPLLATAFAKEGAESLARNDLEHSSYCVNRGLHWTDPQILISEPKKRFVERARTGGFAKDLQREPIRQRVAELFVSRAPNEGWTSIDIAVRAVADYLIFNESSFVEKCNLETDNLPRVIKGWMQSDPGRFVIRIKSQT